MKTFRLTIFGLLLALTLSARAAEPVLLVLGDSLSAGYGINLDQGWVALLEQRLRQQGYPHRVINASISGDTSRGGLARLPEALERHRPAVVVLELGGNDGLRGLPLQTLAHNLSTMIHQAQAVDAQVVLLEMRIPPNYGPHYTEKFQSLYRELAREHGATLAPFFLDGVAGDPALMQGDGIHPGAAAQERMLDNVWPVLEPVLEATGRG